jgi:hypothetical protein
MESSFARLKFLNATEEKQRTRIVYLVISNRCAPTLPIKPKGDAVFEAHSAREHGDFRCLTGRRPKSCALSPVSISSIRTDFAASVTGETTLQSIHA